MKGLDMKKNLGQSTTLKRKNGNGYRKRYGTGEKNERGKSYKSNGTCSQIYYTTLVPRRNGRYLPAKGPGNGQNGNGGDEGRDDKKKFRKTKYDVEDKGEEESDTEDSYELEITPKQLSEVTLGGGVLKIKLSKKRPIVHLVESLIQPKQTLKLSTNLQIKRVDNYHQV